jgi:kynurenine 3-monooxygenase
MEMSSSTADANFLLRKKIEKHFSDKYPELWQPLYSMVTFSYRPYSEALALGDRQKTIMDEVMKTEGIEQKWDNAEVEDKIKALLKEIK